MKKWLFFFLFPFFLFAEEKPIAVVISATTTEWMKENLNSVFDQDYENYRIFYCAEGFSPHQLGLVKRFAEKKQRLDHMIFIETPEGSGPLPGMMRAIFQCEKKEIIIDLDGSDWLAHDRVFETINDLYDNEDVWLTYGQFVAYPHFSRGFASPIPETVMSENAYRNLGGVVTHLKTYYAGLFQEIDKRDFLHDGKFITKATDLAYMIPMLEMAGERVAFVPDVLYVYNSHSPHRFYSEIEEKLDRAIRQKAPYQKLSSFPRDTLFVYDELSNKENPSIEDYHFLQEFLSYGPRENLERLEDMKRVGRDLKIIGNDPRSYPITGKLAINCSEGDRENCLVLYTTLNYRFSEGLKRLIRIVSESDYKGHILYQIGGWPGDVTLAHVPYGFKLSALLEAKKQGYKRALWLDSAVVPLVSLNEIFDQIKNEGYFVMGNSHVVGPYTNEVAPLFWGLMQKETFQIPSCSAGLFGVEFSHSLGGRILPYWEKAARDKDAFYTPRSDQSALSIILYLLGARNLTPLARMPHTEVGDEIQADSLFLLDRGYVIQ